MFDFSKNSKFLWTAWFIVLTFFMVFIVFPLFCVVTAAKPADFTAVLHSDVFHQAIKNTFFECICSSVFAVFTGYVFAYAVVKGNIPFKKFFSFIPVLHIMTPPFVGGLAFILLAGRQGLFTYQLFGLDVSLYGFKGLVIAQTLCFFPMAYLICLQSLSGINQNLEDAARSLGAGNWKIFRTVTFPLSIPGIVSSLLFIAVNVLSDFGNPLIVAGRYRVLAVEIYTQLTGWLNIGTSAVLGIILVIPSLILFWIQNRLFRNVSAKITNQGKNVSPLASKTATVFLTFFVSIVSFCVISQFASIIVGSFQKLWGINRTFTLDHIMAMGRYSTAIRNSLIFALIAALLSSLIASVTSYVVNRTNSPLRKTFDSLVQLPSAIPGTLLGLSLSAASTRLNLRASAFLIVISMTVSFMPFSYRVITQSLSTIRKTLDDSAGSLGANPFIVFSTVVCPLSAKGIFSGFLYDFIRGAGTLSAVIFLVSFNTPLASISIINLAEQGDWGKSCALASLLTLLSFIILGAGYGIVKFEKRRVRL